jgi:pilus assembly protein CpaB
MNQRFLTVLLFAVAVAAAASFFLYRQLASRLTAGAAAPTARVLVANRDLAIGTLVKDFDVREADWAGPVPSHAMQKAEDVLGRGVIANVYAGEPILENRLAPRGAGAGLAAIIPQGMRAVALRVNEVVGVAGFVTPGMRVDVLISGNPPGPNQMAGTRTKTLLQNVEVLSAGQDIQKDAEGKPRSVQVVNVLVTPEHAEILSLAAQQTQIQLVLRNPLDQEEVKTPGTALANLFSGQPLRPEAPPAQVRRAPPPPQPVTVVSQAPERVRIPLIIEVINGTKRTEAKFKEKPEDN